MSVCVCVVVSGARDTAPMLMLADSALRTEERACANMYIYSHKHTHTHTRTHTHTHTHTHTLSHYVITGHRIIEKEERGAESVDVYSPTPSTGLALLLQLHSQTNPDHPP